MFEAAVPSSQVEDWPAAEVADRLVASRVRLLAEEAAQLRMVAHWADLHTPEYVARCALLVDTLNAPAPALAGAERVVLSGADGTELMGEFAGAELGALLGVSTRAGEALITDAVNLRHRHPLLWARVAEAADGALDRVVPVWLGRKVARMCAQAELTLEQAVWVDAQTTPYLATLATGRFLRLVEAKIVAADPEAAEARARQHALARFARAGRVDEDGLRTFVARAAAGDVEHLVAVLDRIAAVLADGGDTDSLESRRAKALRVLANPARALALLLGATLTGLDRAAAEADGVPCGPAPEAARGRLRDGEAGVELVGTPAEPVGWMVDATGALLPPDALRSDLGGPEPVPGPLGGHPALFGEAPGSGPADLESGLDPELLREVLAAVERFDATVFDPVATVHVHVTAETLTGADELCDAGPDAGLGVVRVETATRSGGVRQVGAMAAAAVRAWLADAVGRITVRPVLDVPGLAAVDAYEHTGLMREAVSLRTPFEVFPFGTLSSRGRVDLDHPAPYRSSGPPGQTGLHNAAPLSRKHHRIKTFGGWVLRQERPGVYWWRTRHGHWLRVDPDGTHHHGRDPALDARWLTRAA